MSSIGVMTALMVETGGSATDIIVISVAIVAVIVVQSHFFSNVSNVKFSAPVDFLERGRLGHRLGIDANFS